MTVNSLQTFGLDVNVIGHGHQGIEISIMFAAVLLFLKMKGSDGLMSKTPGYRSEGHWFKHWYH